MRLLYVCSDFGISPSGTKGAAVHLREITRALAELGHRVCLLSPQDGPEANHPALRLLPADCHEVKATTRPLKQWLTHRGFGKAAAKELRSLLYNGWVHDRALAALGDHPPHAIIERLALFSHVGVDLCETLGVPLILEVNALLTEEARRFRKLELQTLAEEIEHRVLQRAAAIITVSAPLAERLAAAGTAPDKIHVIPNGVDLRAFEALPDPAACRARLGVENPFVVGFCGSLKPWHGVDVLLSAFGRFVERSGPAHLLVVGGGPAEQALRRRAAELRLETSVTFTGAVPHEQVPALLGAMDVAAAPFRSMQDFYFSPIKLFEYMASGSCVVASRLGQIQEVIQDHVNGLLCRPDDAEALCAALLEARHSAELRRRLGQAARATVRSRYTWQRAAEQTVAVIGATLAAGDCRSGLCRPMHEAMEVPS